MTRVWPEHEEDYGDEYYEYPDRYWYDDQSDVNAMMERLRNAYDD